jgi:hypothetical protein
MERQGHCSAVAAGGEEEKMASVEVYEPVPQEPKDLEKLFQELTEQWRAETAHHSSVTKKAMHPAYQRIIGMGPAVIPLILRDLEQEPDHWFWALTALTGEDPVPPEDAGDIDKMAQAWLARGRQLGYL